MKRIETKIKRDVGGKKKLDGLELCAEGELPSDLVWGVGFGSMPMGVLEQHIDWFIDEERR